jgi:hypothetical protein
MTPMSGLRTTRTSRWGETPLETECGNEPSAAAAEDDHVLDGEFHVENL